MNEKLERVLENHGTKLLSGGIGLFIGAGDMVSSGYPILTVGLPVWDLIKLTESQSYFGNDSLIDWKEGLTNYTKGLISYSVGASIPFAINYSNEITTFLSNLIDKF